jgi:hypothetical protein
VAVARPLAFTLLLALAGSASAQAASAASELPIEWQAPESCPDAQALTRRLGALLGETPSHLGKLSSVRAVVQETPSGKQLTLDVEESGQHTSRQFESGDCSDLIDAAALAIALALHGEAAPPVEPLASSAAPPRELDTNPPGPEPSPWGWSLAAEAALDSGALPALAPGAGARARLLLGAWSVDGHALFLLNQRVALGNAEAVDFGLFVAGTRVCRDVLERAVHLAACATVEAGRFHASGAHLPTSRALADLWLAAGGGIEAEARAGGEVWLQFRLEPVVPLDRKRYAVDGSQVVHTPAALDLRFYLGLSVNGP